MKTERKKLESCVTPDGTFIYGIHKPSYLVTNLREKTITDNLGADQQNRPVTNSDNYPDTDIMVEEAHWIFEIPNPFPFKGRTFIDKQWADTSADNPDKIALPQPAEISLTATLKESGFSQELISKLPAPLQLALATSSTDAEDLVWLAELSCEITRDSSGRIGLRYSRSASGKLRAVIHDHPLFEAVANNPDLPDDYKIAMVVRPGAQGGSEIIGEWTGGSNSHIYEYLRQNSYIAGGHYAANMADDALRYSVEALTAEDMAGLRHLYYQRTYVQLAGQLGIEVVKESTPLTVEQLESLRLQITSKIDETPDSLKLATLWGWNFGFDFAPSLYRLHASHQQVHQQYALVPENVKAYTEGNEKSSGELSAYSCGDLLEGVIERYQQEHSSDFFSDYLRAISTNRRMDGRRDLHSSLVVWQDEQAMLFVPKAQTSQWELQLMTLGKMGGLAPGNIIECTPLQRQSLDRGILYAQKALAGLGAKMVTTIEYSKRVATDKQLNQPLLYVFLPRLPQSPGAFSEAQLRYINGHYPEDFAARCREALACS
jgi:hypothetical protein